MEGEAPTEVLSSTIGEKQTPKNKQKRNRKKSKSQLEPQLQVEAEMNSRNPNQLPYIHSPLQQQQNPQNRNAHQQQNRQFQNHQTHHQQNHHLLQQQQYQQHHRRHQQRQQQQRKFEPYWSPSAVEEALKREELLEGFIRVNPKNYEDAYIPDPKGKHQVHLNFCDRNRALNGDRVAVQIKEKTEWIAQIDLLQDKLAKSPNDFHPFLLQELQKIVDNLSDEDDDVEVEASDVKSEGGSSSVVSSSGSSTAPKDEDNVESSSSSTATATDASPLDAPIPTLNQVREQLPPEIRSLVDQMEKSWKDGLKDEATTAATSNGVANGNHNNKQRQRKNTLRSNSVTTKSLAVLFKDFLHTEAGQTLIQEFPDELLQKTGKVVLVTKPVHTRMACGILKPLADGNPNMALFSPNDHRLPRMLVPMTDCPKDFRQRPSDYAKTLFIAQIAEWKETSMMAHGNVVRSLGDAGDIDAEHEGLLIEHGFDSSDFSDDVIACLPYVDPEKGLYQIPDEEIKKRNSSGFDYRSSCVFTVDPATARDLDDALHCEHLGDGIFEIGVHIADVSFFVRDGTALDQVANERATSVYCVHRMIPMLPRLLCEQLCSLHPGVDRLSFSVVWKITEDGEIIDEKFGSSIIRSCAKLAYEHAQGFMDDPAKSWSKEELPEISGGWTFHHLVESVLHLQKVAQNLRRKRFQNGALRLDQVKLAYDLHPESRMPVGFHVYEHNDSHRLIEEFMLLANMAIAHRLQQVYPEKAMLRRHPPPQENLMESIERFCESLSLHVDISSSGALQASLQSLVAPDAFAAARLQVLTSMFSRPMQLAEYFCAGSVEEEDDYHHYALNVPLYTHFTSPIRRYPDVIVHRMLRASLENIPDSDEALGAISDLATSANRSNVMKASAKKVSEASSEIFFALYIKQCGPIEETAMVMALLDKSFDVFVMRSGIVKRVYLEKCDLSSFRLRKPRAKPPFLQLFWRPPPSKEGEEGEGEETEETTTTTTTTTRTTTQDLHIFSLVRVRLQTEEDPLKYSAVLLHPSDGEIE